MAGGPAVITDHQARDVHWLEVRKRKASYARKVVIIPASVGGADQTPAVSVVGQNNSKVSERGDDNGRLWTCVGTRGSGHGSLQPVDLSSRSGHAAAYGRRRLRNLRFRGNVSPARSRARPHTRCLRSRPDPVIQRMIQGESDRMLNRAVRRTGRARPDYLICVSKQGTYRKSGGIGCSHALLCQVIRTYVGPKCVRGVGPGTALVYSLPHFVESRGLSTAGLQVDQNVHISTRVDRIRGAFNWSIRWNRPGAEIRLIHGGCDRYVRLVRRNFDGRYSIGKVSILIPEERLDRL